MKAKVLMILAICLGAVSCTSGDVYHNETIIKGVSIFTDRIEALGDKWQESGRVGTPGYYLYQEYKFPEITQDVINKGAVLVYLIDADKRENILPYVYPLDNGANLVMQNFRFEVEKGILTLVVESQDFGDYGRLDSKYIFKVCIIKP